MKKYSLIKKGVAAVAVSAVTASAVSYILTKKLTEVAIKRKTPKSMEIVKKIVSGSDAYKDIISAQNEAAKKLEESDTKEVRITSFDGTELVGHLKECPDAKRITICFHGWRSSWSLDYGMAAEHFDEAKTTALFVEQRAHGNSGGEHIGFGLLERRDCVEWAKWADENLPKHLPIYLSGISLGATTVLMACADPEMPKRVHGITADCGFTSPYAIWKHITEGNLHIPFKGMPALIANDVCRKAINHNYDEYSTVTAVKETKIPILFIHGTKDQMVPITMTYENYQACTSPKRLLIVPGAEHGTSWLVETEKYKQEIAEFHKMCDNTKPERE